MKGQKTGGRTKGIPNKVTRDIRACISEAFHKAGGVEYLLKVSKEDARTFLTLVGKIVPQEVVATVTQYVAELPKTAPTVQEWQQQHQPPHHTVQ